MVNGDLYPPKRAKSPIVLIEWTCNIVWCRFVAGRVRSCTLTATHRTIAKRLALSEHDCKIKVLQDEIITLPLDIPRYRYTYIVGSSVWLDTKNILFMEEINSKSPSLKICLMNYNSKLAS